MIAVAIANHSQLIFGRRRNYKIDLELNHPNYWEFKMSIAVSIPTILRSYTNNEKSVTAQGTNLQEVIADLETQFPGISERLIEDGNLRRFVNIYINDEDVRFTGSLAAAVSAGDAITVLPAVAGGWFIKCAMTHF